MNDIWWQAPLVALDLEGTGAQDKNQEAILEIAAVRLVNGRPDQDTAFHSLINPGRPVPHRPWISPGLTDTTLATAPTTATVSTTLAPRLHACYLVGHNIRVDWKLLHRHFPTIEIAGLIDTLRLARTATPGMRHSLTALLDHFNLTDEVTATTGSQPHRASGTPSAPRTCSTRSSDTTGPKNPPSPRFSTSPASRPKATDHNQHRDPSRMPCSMWASLTTSDDRQLPSAGPILQAPPSSRTSGPPVIKSGGSQSTRLDYSMRGERTRGSGDGQDRAGREDRPRGSSTVRARSTSSRVAVPRTHARGEPCTRLEGVRPVRTRIGSGRGPVGFPHGRMQVIRAPRSSCAS